MVANQAPNLSPIAVADEHRDERLNDMRIQPTDGPIVRAMKWLANCPIFHWPIDCFVRRYFNLRGVATNVIADSDARNLFRAAVEWYWILWTVALLAVYFAMVWLVRGGFGAERATWTATACAVLFAVALARLFEILATIVWLHFMNRYKTDNIAHALAVTFLAFFQVGLAFSILYCGVAYFAADSFSHQNGGLVAGWIDPFYFSIFTLGTLGFGDLKPESSAGRFLVICELSFGLLLIVIAFQRVLASAK